MFHNLRELILTLQDEKSCQEYLAKQRWPDGKVTCPKCGWDKCYSIEKGKRYKCGNKDCYLKFSIRVGTIFEQSNVPLVKWFTAVYLATAHKKGISSYQLAKDIGVSQRCAWFMLHRIREMMRPKENVKLDNIVELDEVYLGGKIGRMSKKKRKMLHDNEEWKRNKQVVIGMIERGGNLKLIHVGKEIEINTPTVHPIIRDNVDTDAVLLTDTSTLYNGLNQEYAGHESVNHTQDEYVRDGVIHTNSIEGAFSHFRRSIYGIYHKVTVKHLSRYCDETAFRYNLRKLKDADRFTVALQQVEGALPYKKLIASKLPKIVLTAAHPHMLRDYTEGHRPGKNGYICQIRDEKIVAKYPTIKMAAEINKISVTSVREALIGKQKTAGGYEWKYA